MGYGERQKAQSKRCRESAPKLYHVSRAGQAIPNKAIMVERGGEGFAMVISLEL